MTERAGRTRADAAITVPKYQPSAYDQPEEGPVLSGTGELTGLRGEGGFRANLGESAQVHLDYWFE
jgi:hypothetical protein